MIPRKKEVRILSLADRIENDRRRKSFEDNQKKIMQMVADLHHKQDINEVSRPRMCNTIALQHSKLNYMLVELFCVDPDHCIFQPPKTPDRKEFNDDKEYESSLALWKKACEVQEYTVLAPLRLERLKRIEEGRILIGEQFLQGEKLLE